ncbi:MAG: hypothetical protein JO314_00475 [Acidobacteria bacterium]|nr:hypothetical protein [Acidobacteriota bacterium]
MADKIREFESSKDLKRIAEDVLPELEKFLESPAERRLRRIRAGTLLSFIGIGGAIGFLVVALASRDQGLLFPAAAGGVTFFIGLAIVINGYLHTVARVKEKDDGTAKFDVAALSGTTSDLKLPGGEPPRPFSVTEGTTTHLGEKQPIRRD